ncbi:MAG: hypothetical protein M3Q97_07965 [Bacteroidota bacterium]|nr:hypothetical protein [Bacteroidota bacterium]
MTTFLLKSLLTAGLCLSITASYAQTYQTKHGADIPVSGTIRVFLVFAEVNCDSCSPFNCYPDDSAWPAG